MAKPARKAATQVARRDNSKPLRLTVKNGIEQLQGAIVGKDKDVQALLLSDPALASAVRRIISSRSIAVDRATHGGFPAARLVEIFGGENVGKTTLVQSVIAQTQALGGVVAAWDSEDKWDVKYARTLGVKPEEVVMIEPGAKSLEVAIDKTEQVVDRWVEKGLQALPLMVVWDSVAGMPTLDEMSTGIAQENKKTGEMQKQYSQPGEAAKLLRLAMRKLTHKVARAGALWVIVNQQYEKIGGFSPVPGVRKSTFGGGGIRYHATMRIELSRVGALKDGQGNHIGQEGICRVYKNSMGAPRDEPYAIQHGVGFQNAWSILEKLKEYRYITQASGHYKFSAQGFPDVTWQGNWQGLTDLLVQYPEVAKTMGTIFMGLV